MIRFQITAMIDGTVADRNAYERMLTSLRSADWMALVEIDQGGQHPDPCATGGWNPISVEIVSEG